MKRVVFLLTLFLSTTAFAQDDHLNILIERAESSWAGLNDYSATFKKQELSGGVMGPKETIFLKFEKPFKIFLGWLDTRKKGLQVLYERGQRDNTLAIHQPGLMFGLAKVVYLPQDSPWVREGSESYDIEDAGIGTFLEDFSSAVKKADSEGKLEVKWDDAQTADVTFRGSKEGEGYFAYRAVVHFDPATGLTDRMRLFDWQDKLTGEYSYEDLKPASGASDAEFKRIALGKLYRLYFPQPKAAGKDFSGKSRPATPKEAGTPPEPRR